jgi:sugar fermentation stimulation protein A
MKFESPLLEGRLIQRHQRFLADVELVNGQRVTAHCPNTGSMLGCLDSGNRVWLSAARNPQRKLAWTWELVEVQGRIQVGINTQRANALVEEAIVHGRLPELGTSARIRREVAYGRESSRADFVLEEALRPRCVIEVKNVTAAVTQGIALFPDAPSVRACRHARELAHEVLGGGRAALVFCVQRPDVTEVRPADAIDPDYGLALRHAMAAGVHVFAMRAQVGLDEIVLSDRIPVRCPQLPSS